MSILYEERPSDSPFIETIMHGRTLSAGSSTRPAESCWYLVFAKHQGRINPVFVGQWTTAGTASWGEEAEIHWIKFKLGVFLRHLPPNKFLNTETNLPGVGSQSFWLNGSAWQTPDFENVETFVDWLVREDTLALDPVVDLAIHGRPVEMSPRTVRQRFLQATGLTRSRNFQIEPVQQAAARLQDGISILDTVFELGYYDQPHLTRSLKQWVGQTPAQISRLSQLE